MTKIHLCGECYLQVFCRRLTSRIVSDDELTPAFLRDVRRVMAAMDVTRDAWPGLLIASYRDYPGRIVDTNGDETALDTEAFNRPNIRDWFRYLCEPIPESITQRLRREAKPRFIVTATILRAAYPVPAMLWGKDIANDCDLPPLPANRQAECRHCQVTKITRFS